MKWHTAKVDGNPRNQYKAGPLTLSYTRYGGWVIFNTMLDRIVARHAYLESAKREGAQMLRSMAYDAIERDALSASDVTAELAYAAMDKFLRHEMPLNEVFEWADREAEFLSLK
jgi:hypothetical protein